MDPVLTYSALGGLFLGGITVAALLWNIHTKVVAQHSKEDEKLAAIYTRIDEVRSQLESKYDEKHTQIDKRIDRNKEECRRNEHDLGEKITALRIDLVKKTDLRELEKSIEGNVEKTVDTRIAQLEAKIPQIMLDVMKNFNQS